MALEGMPQVTGVAVNYLTQADLKTSVFG